MKTRPFGPNGQHLDYGGATMYGWEKLVQSRTLVLSAYIQFSLFCLFYNTQKEPSLHPQTMATDQVLEKEDFWLSTAKAVPAMTPRPRPPSILQTARRRLVQQRKCLRRRRRLPPRGSNCGGPKTCVTRGWARTKPVLTTDLMSRAHVLSERSNRADATHTTALAEPIRPPQLSRRWSMTSSPTSYVSTGAGLLDSRQAVT
ncbi:uncharacterized protein BKA78DRAFT_129818 [Phyllosticta capitalensis]|uniref:uncharacterized protein n=1 Tax=Phyllosticta capitalensis TaxID=121624 RepID=UPI00312D0FD2